jgi:hypothetical protein
MHQKNKEAIKLRVGDKLGVCGLWRCRACVDRQGIIYYEVQKDGSMSCNCSNKDCEDHVPGGIGKQCK